MLIVSSMAAGAASWSPPVHATRGRSAVTARTSCGTATLSKRRSVPATGRMSRARRPAALAAVETPAYEPHTRVRDRREGRRRHAGRAAAAHVPQSVIKNALAVLVFPKKHGHLALIADPADLHVAVVCGADGVVAGPRALVGAQRAPSSARQSLFR